MMKYEAPHGWDEIIYFYSLPSRDATGAVTQKWKDTNLMTVEVPFRLHLAWADVWVGRVTVHHKIVEPLLDALEAVKHAGLADFLSKDYGGSYQDRAKRGNGKISLHAFGAAIDFRIMANPLGRKPEPEMYNVAKLFIPLGWTWGGNFVGRKDGMHFQFGSGY